MFNYVVTANKPTAVTHSVVGNFTSPIDINLIVCKSTRIEIHVSTTAGLQPLLDVGIYGRVAALELYRPHGEPQDWLLVLTERYKFFVLAYDSKSGEIITKANGDVGSRIGRPVDIGQIAMVDPDCRVIGMHLYDGLFKVIPIDPKGMLKEAFDIRMEETRVLDIKFLYGLSKPTVAVLYQDPKEARHVKTYEISLKDKDFADGPKSLSNLEAGASFIIPVPSPLGGMLIVGEQSITYQGVSNNTIKSIALKTTTIMKAFGKIDVDGSRYLLGDFLGNIYVVILDHDGGSLSDLKIERLGETSIPSTISYIDSSGVFIGSTYGDSQLIKLNSSKDETDSFLQVQETFANMGPITDFVVVDLDRQGQGQVVACSGAFKHGTLRIIRSGIGINEQASIDLPGIKGLWSLKTPQDKAYDKFIILSFVGETRVLAMTGEELEETSIDGFRLDEQTIHCANVVDDLLLQITTKSINLVDGNTLQSVHKWTPPPTVNINVASCTKNQIILGTGGGSLVYIEIHDKQLKEIAHKKLEHEISCVNISPLGSKDQAEICAVGMWTDITVRLFTIPNLTMIASEPLGGEIIPRSVLLVSLEGINYLLCALGDGHLFTFVLGGTDQFLRDKRKVSLSTQPIILNTFRANGIVNVFAASDRPTVIYSNNKKLLYSNVNLKEANYMCPFNSESFPESLAIGTEESLKIGTIDSIQKLHIRTVPLGGEMPRRIAHQEATNTFCVLTLKTSSDPDSPDAETGYVKFLDATTFETLGSYKLGDFESPCSATSLLLGDDPTPFYVVGTAFAVPSESEPSKGRILLFSISEGKHKLISEHEVKGAVYALSPFNGRILAGVNSKVHLYSWVGTDDGGRKLKLECSHSGHLLALYLAVRGDFIVVGDLMKSISLLAYRTTDNTIEEIARDYDAKWMTAVEVLDDDTFIGAENSFNLFTVKRNSDAATDDDRSRLEVSGLFHLGEFVNRFRTGSLVMRLPDTEAATIKTILYGSVNGTIGVVASISAEQFSFFLKVQQNLEKVIKGIGGLSHSDWRAFSNDKKTVESRNFIDGDLIEIILDLKPEKVAEVAKGLDVSADELIKRVESMQQALH